MRQVLIASLAFLLMSQTGRAAELSIVGAWVLNKDLTPMPDGAQRRPAEEGHRGGGGRGGGGRGGFGGFGGGGGPHEPSDAEIHKMEAIRDRLSDIPDHLTITRTDTSVTIADAFGRTMTLKTDGKKQPRLTGEGEFNSKSHFDGAKLMVEDDFNGPKVLTTFEPILDRGEIRQLKVTISVDGMGGRGGGGGYSGGGGYPGGGGHGGGGRGGPPPQQGGGAEGQHRPGREVVRIYDAEEK
jgi:hypothetical protein